MDPGSSPTALPEAPRDPRVGTLIGDRYRLLARIGEGGMGAVYRAEHVLMKKVVALKLLHGELGNIDDPARRFEREAQSASRLNHPNIIGVTDFGRAVTGELFLVMEYVPGVSLAEVLEGGRLPVERALAITRQILDGLAHAHAQGVIHRDLKPANIMLATYPELRPGEVVKILDFGIAKLLSPTANEPGEAPLTRGAMVFGTPSYMSPEQATAQDADLRSDVYSCGVMLFEMLTGRKPFVADDLIKVMAMQVTQAPPRLAAVAPDAEIPPALEAVVMRALEKDRARRFATAGAFREALEQLPQDRVRVLAQRLPVLWDTTTAIVRREVSRLPFSVRRWLRPALIGLGVLVLALPLVCARHPPPTAPAAAPPPPKPVEPALKAPLKRIEEAVARGQLAEARLMLMEQISQNPSNGRMRYLLGNLDFAEKNPSAGLTAYDEALKLDPGLRGDAAMLMNVRNLLPSKTLGRAALDLMAERIGRPAGATLADVASEDKRPEFRQVAREACKLVGCGDKVDLVKSYALDLQQGRTCEAKRAAVQGLGTTKDVRIIDILKKARRSGGGLLGDIFGGGGNRCIRKDIDAVLADMGVDPNERPERQERQEREAR